MELNKEYTKFGRQTSFVLGATIIGSLFGFIMIPILTKGLGVQLYGTYSLVQTTILLLSPIALLGLTAAFIRFFAAEKDKSKIREGFFSLNSIILISGIAPSLLLFFSSEQLAILIFGDFSLAIYIKLASAVVLLNAITSFGLTFFRTFRQIGLYTTLGLSNRVCQTGLIILAILLGFQLVGVIIAMILIGIIYDLVILFIIIKQIGIRLPRFVNIKPYLEYGIPLTPNIAISWIIGSSDRYMVSYFMGIAATGVYSAAYVLASYVSFTLTPLITVLSPTVIKSYDEKNLNETIKYLKYSFRYFMMIAIPSAFGLSILAKPVLQILTTPEFVHGSIIVPFIALGTILYGINQISNTIIHLIKRTGLIIRLLSVSAALNIALNFILIPRMGIIGAAVATLVAYGVLGLLTLIITRRYIKFNLSLPFILKSVFSAVIMTLCIWLINPESLVTTIVSIIGSALMYFAVLWLIKGLSKEEITFFTNFAKDTMKRITRKK